MRPSIERLPNLNDLVNSVPEEIVRQIQQEAVAEPESTSESKTMSSERKPSKSKRIRDYIEAHSSATTKEIVAALNQYGVTQSDVGNVRSKQKGSSPAKRANSKKSAAAPSAKTPVSPVAPASTGINLKVLEYGTLFLKEAGSLNNARELLIVIDRIRSV